MLIITKYFTRDPTRANRDANIGQVLREVALSSRFFCIRRIVTLNYPRPRNYSGYYLNYLS